MLTEAHIRRLKTINSIESLLTFLREELEWPITDGDKEDVTFTYDAADLGLKEEHAPKVNRIYQIRPITTDQPWGIFFIDFDNKKIPVTIMRRILNGLVKKKRGGNTGSGWNAGDLLFMTTYGEEAEGMREVAFAHFHEQPGDLPTLNVLQWDAQDTPTKLQNTYSTLKSNLGWPPNPANKEEWRKQWTKSFRHGIGHTIKTAKALAEELAKLSQNIRDRVAVILEAETEKGQMTKLYEAFKSALIHDLKPEDFADTFAQTITYGLFSAAVSRRMPEESGSKSLTTESIAQLVPSTNPFLKEVLETFLDVGGRKGGIDFDELGVQEVVELLRSDETDLRAVLEDFGNRKQGEDPVIHFYEDFLKAYNKELKVKRGVFYTPQPVVSYIVRSVHELLQTEFGLEDGLASTTTWGEMSARNPDVRIPEGTHADDPFVVILDPATGTATFLVEVIDTIHKHLQAKWNTERPAALTLLRTNPNQSEQIRTFPDFWNAYVPDYLLPRLYGYELMMAPYAIAHMKVGLKLGETGYTFGTDKRVRIYLTNALEPASELQARLALDWEALAHEAMAVKAVKEIQRFTVVIGNPPYSIQSQNLTPSSRSLIDPYRQVDGVPVVERNALQLEKNLQDDYIKFIRLSQITIDDVGLGVVGLVTNHGYLDGATFRGMRWSLLESFPGIFILDLHGNSTKREVSPDGSHDENVFDISQGVAVTFLTKEGTERATRIRRLANSWGERGDVSQGSGKYAWLQRNTSSTTISEAIEPTKSLFLFKRSESESEDEYARFWIQPEIMPLYSMGIKTSRDELVIDFAAGPIIERIERFRSAVGSDAEVCEELEIPQKKGWNVSKARKDLRALSELHLEIKPFLYRPFDWRPLFYHKAVVFSAAYPVMRSLLTDRNLALVVTRQTKDQWDVQCCRTLVGHKSLGAYDANSVFTLFRYPTEKEFAKGIGREPNLNSGYLDALAVAVGRRFEPGSCTVEHGGLFAGGDLLVDLDQPPLGAFGDGLSSVQGSLVTAPDPVVYPAGPSFSPEDVLHYIYAVLHSPAYRSRYAEFLKIDFPRIPLPGGPQVFDALVPLGAELVALHLMESPRLETPMTTFQGPGEPRVEKVSYSKGTVWIDKAQTSGFQSVPEEIWNFHIGGYQVCEKWLKDRGPKGKEKDKDGKEVRKPGRILSPEDIAHYQKIVIALSETIRIMKEIDIAIDQHGGWPGAFQGSEK